MDMIYEIGGLLLMLAILAGVVYWRLEKDGLLTRRETPETVARKLLEQIGRSNLEIRDAGTSLDVLQTEIKLLSSAIAELRRMIFAEPDRHEKERFETALKKLEKGDSGEAAAIFDAVFDSLKIEMKTSGESYRELRRRAAMSACHAGIVQYLNDTPLALTAFIRAAEFDPDNPQLWSMLGAVWMRLGELDNAENLLRRAFGMQRDPAEKAQLASDMANLGGLYAGKEDYSKACDFWRRARSLYAGTGQDERLERVDRLMRDASCSEDKRGDKIH